jgi:hypothetical protein
MRIIKFTFPMTKAVRGPIPRQPEPAWAAKRPSGVEFAGVPATRAQND